MNSAVFRPVITVGDPLAVTEWLCEKLFFHKTNERGVLKNGNCELQLIQGQTQKVPDYILGSYYIGPEHIALRTADITKAQEHCQACGIELNLLNGKAYFNPGVYGEGEYYFNFFTPFGLIMEISQRVSQPHYGETNIIEGLDHIGIPTSDLQVQLKNLKKLGFLAEFETVYNQNEREGRVACCMVKKEDVVLEVYQFEDLLPQSKPANPNLTLPSIKLVN